MEKRNGKEKERPENPLKRNPPPFLM